MIGRLALAAASSLLVTASPPGVGASSSDFVPAPADGNQWQLVFDENFDRLDPSIWNVRGDGPRAGGMWLKNNASVRNGKLFLTTTRQNGRMATAGIDTDGKRNWRYGYFVMRAKLPLQPAGHRPAFWLQTQGTFSKADEGRDGTEIDIFEAWSRAGRVQHNLHWDVSRKGPDRQSTGITSPVPISYNEWHEFGLYWTPTEYRFYIDGKPSWTTSAGGVSQVPEAIRITDEALERNRAAFMTNFRGPTADPFVIDYVRVYQEVRGTGDSRR